MGFLDFDNEEKGYKKFHLNTQSIKENIGKKICFVLSRDYDNHRGYYNVRYGTIISKRYSQLFIDDEHNSIDIRDVLECGIEID